MNKFHKLSEQMYQQAQAEQAAQGGEEASQNQSNDDVVDADFKEV